MKNKLLRIGFTLSVIGSLSAVTLCIIALFNPFFFPGFLMLCSFIILLSGFVVLFIDCQNDSQSQQKIYEDVEFLTVIFKEIQKKNILNQMLINRLLSEFEELDEHV
jgi:hypothetical protein